MSNLVRGLYLFLPSSFSSMHDIVVFRKLGGLGILPFATNIARPTGVSSKILQMAALPTRKSPNSI